MSLYMYILMYIWIQSYTSIYAYLNEMYIYICIYIYIYIYIYLKYVNIYINIYIYTHFNHFIGMQNILPQAFLARPAFYREQQSEMYSPFIYTATAFLVEIPYNVASSFSFVLPFWTIINFYSVGNPIVKVR
jgi:hypothetical protein